MLSENPAKTLTLEGLPPIQLNLTTGRLILAAEKGMEISDIESGLLGQMFTSPIVLANAVWAIFEDRIVAAGVETEVAFYDLLDAKANRELDAAVKAAVSDFFTWGSAYIVQVNKAIENLSGSPEVTLEPSGGTTSGISPES